MPVRIFLLSPANASGERMQMLLRPAARFDLAVRLREGAATLGEAFEYARERTIRDTARFAAETQHPSYDVHLRGRQVQVRYEPFEWSLMEVWHRDSFCGLARRCDKHLNAKTYSFDDYER